jgi:hypothetical protein
MRMDPATIVKLRNLREEMWFQEGGDRPTTRDLVRELLDILIFQFEQDETP